MSRIRLNQELRNKIGSRWRVHAEQEETDEKEISVIAIKSNTFILCLFLQLFSIIFINGYFISTI